MTENDSSTRNKSQPQKDDGGPRNEAGEIIIPETAVNHVAIAEAAAATAKSGTEPVQISGKSDEVDFKLEGTVLQELQDNSELFNTDVVVTSAQPPDPSLAAEDNELNTDGTFLKTDLTTLNPKPAHKKGSLPKQSAKGKRGKSYRPFKRRWYVLGVYCIFSLTQTWIWNTFGPITFSACLALGLNINYITLLSSLGPIAFVFSGVFFAWLLTVRGLRVACIVAAGLVALGTALRCFISFIPTATTGIIIVGHILNGLGGPMANIAAPKLSANWFPAQERAGATTVSVMSLYMGLAFSFFIGPIVVTAPNEEEVIANYTAQSKAESSTCPQTVEPKDANKVRSEIEKLFYFEAVWSALVLVLMALYFPNHPPMPVSPSSLVRRESFQQGAKSLCSSHRWVLVMAAVYAMSVGLLNCWSISLHENLKLYGLTQKETASLGFFATLSAMTLSLSMARCIDKYFRYMRRVLIGLLAVGAFSVLLFNLAISKLIIRNDIELLCVTVVTGIVSVVSSYPILFELSCELAFPISEGMTAMLLTLASNALALFVLAISFVPGAGIMWINWTLLVCLTAATVLLVYVPQTYPRYDLDL